MQRSLLWNGIDVWRAEAALVDLTGDGIRAGGTQLVSTASHRYP
ncbi:MAG: hypothetical protein ACRDNE_06050 [Gaiellaceae bacterium]